MNPPLRGRRTNGRFRVRIAWVIYGALDQTTGGYIYDLEMVAGLGARGHDVDVVSLPQVGPVLVRLIEQGAYDVCVGDELCFRDLGPLFESIRHGPRRLLLVHHLSRWGGGNETDHAAEQRALDAADVCVATSLATAERLVAEGCRVAVDVVEPGADRIARTGGIPLRRADGGALLFVGNLLEHKQVHTLIAAFDSAAAPDARLHIVGDERRDPAYAALLRAAVQKSSRLSASVTFKGAIDNHALAGAIADAAALVLPSSLEGYGMVLTEAVAAGTPVICTTACPASALLEKSGAALVVPAGNVTELGRALAAFTNDAGLRATMKAAAMAFAPHLPKWSDAVTAFEKLILPVR